MNRSSSLDRLKNIGQLVIPTFTVTINPLEENEVTFVPESPTFEGVCPAATESSNTNIEADSNGNSKMGVMGSGSVPHSVSPELSTQERL